MLVADDQPDVLLALRLLLKEAGLEAVGCASPAEVLGRVRAERFDAALIDLNYAHATTSGREGIDLLTQLGELAPELPVVVMTAWGSVPAAVLATQRGARDFIEKPWDNQRLLRVLTTQVALSRALHEASRLREENRRLTTARFAPPLVGRSVAMSALRRLLERVGPAEVTALITGEHGTGKEVVARQLHATSARARGPFVAIDAGGYSDGVIDSELFGHAKGAFTDAKRERPGAFEAAQSGTLFLDEVGNMPLPQQGKLLRVLQSREVTRVGETRPRPVDVRVLAAANVDLEVEVKAGRFREDLLYRLNAVELRLPPLRERGDDIVELAAHFLAQANERTGLEYQLGAGAVERLKAHPWPGNVRELSHAIERAVLLADGSHISVADLHLPVPVPQASAGPLSSLTLEQAEAAMIRQALQRCEGNVTHAAVRLGVTRSSLYRRLQRHHIDPSKP